MKNAEVIAESIKREYLARLRDDFAAKAMQAWLMNADRVEEDFDDACLFEAKLAYKMADAMIKARDAD